MTQSRSLRRSSTLRSKGSKGSSDSLGSPAATPRSIAEDRLRGGLAQPPVPPPEPKRDAPEAKREGTPAQPPPQRAKTPAAKKASAKTSSKAGSRSRDDPADRRARSTGAQEQPGSKPAVSNGAINETDVGVDNTDAGQRDLDDPQSLRAELSAAWELCRELQGRIRDQDLKLERHSQELSRWRGVGEDMRMLRAAMDKGEVPNFKSSPPGSSPPSSPNHSRPGSPPRVVAQLPRSHSAAAAGVSGPSEIKIIPANASPASLGVRHIQTPSSPRLSPQVPGIGFTHAVVGPPYKEIYTTTVDAVAAAMAHQRDARMRNSFSPTTRYYMRLGPAVNVREKGRISPQPPLPMSARLRLVSPSRLNTVPSVGSAGRFQFSARDEMGPQTCLTTPVPPPGIIPL